MSYSICGQPISRGLMSLHPHSCWFNGSEPASVSSARSTLYFVMLILILYHWPSLTCPFKLCPSQTSFVLQCDIFVPGDDKQWELLGAPEQGCLHVGEHFCLHSALISLGLLTQGAGMRRPVCVCQVYWNPFQKYQGSHGMEGGAFEEY